MALKGSKGHHRTLSAAQKAAALKNLARGRKKAHRRTLTHHARKAKKKA